ncbi:MAG: hypothetical protein GF388_08450 [Candidatus Aegiribacteria sp.]|nr:hypothetical protein [Candidatus Aegiribacteria sp.]MBD3295113.1 hypothetical protein [Candidatus Fermentibacteria bacterium]
MKLLAALLLSVIAFLACSTSDKTVIDQQEMERIQGELGAGACRNRMDSLCFEIDGLLYRATLDDDDRSVRQLLADSLPACPVSGLDYIVEETETRVTVTCPSGHGSQTADK